MDAHIKKVYVPMTETGFYSSSIEWYCINYHCVGGCHGCGNNSIYSGKYIELRY